MATKKRQGSEIPTADVSRRSPPIRSTVITLVDPAVWHSLAASGMLSSQELGRLLLFTSATAFTNQNDRGDSADKNDTIWKMLCINHWGAEKAETFLEIADMTPKDYFFTFAFPPKKQPFLPPLHDYEKQRFIPPLRYTPDDYVLIVDVRKEEGTIVFCEAVEGGSIPDFFQRGSTDVIDPKSPMIDPMIDAITHDEEVVRFSFKGTIHLIRRPDRKVIKLLDIDIKTERISLLDGTIHVEREASASWGMNLDKTVFLPRLQHALRTDLMLGYQAVVSAGKTTIRISNLRVSVLLGIGGVENYTAENVKYYTDLSFSHVLESLVDLDDTPSHATTS